MLYLYGKNATDFTTNGEPIRNSYDEHVIRDEGFYLSFKLLLDKEEQYKIIKKEMIISALTPEGRNQFRVYDTWKRDTYVEIMAVQLMYDFDNKQVNSFKLKKANGKQVIQSFQNSFKSPLSTFTLDSSVTELHDFSTNDEDDNTLNHNALEILNRITKRWDSELMLNGFDIRMIKRLGKKTDALLYEKKNISEFEDESTMRGMATRIHATSTFRAEGSEEDTTISVTVDSPLLDEYAQVYEKSYVNNDCHTEAELIAWVKLKYSTENMDKPKRTIQVATNIIDGTEINYGDDLVLKYLIHDVDEIIRCVGYDYDPIGQIYYGVTLGDWKDSFLNTVTGNIVDTTNQQINQIKNNVTHIGMAANGRNRVAWGPHPVPNPIDGDLWYYFELDRPNEQELRIYFNGEWHPMDFATKKEVEQAQATADQAKQDAIKAHDDAVLEAGRLVKEQSAKFVTDLKTQKEQIETSFELGYSAAVQESVDAVYEDIDNLRTNILKSNVITSEHLKVDNAMIERLMVDGILAQEIITDSLMADSIKTNAISAIRADMEYIRTNVLLANSITSEHIKSDSATINKLFATDALVETLTSKAAFINNIKAIDIEADRITTGVLNASKVNIINLNANNITTGTLNSIRIVNNFARGGVTGQITIGSDINMSASDGSRFLLSERRISFSDGDYETILKSDGLDFLRKGVKHMGQRFFTFEDGTSGIRFESRHIGERALSIRGNQLLSHDGYGGREGEHHLYLSPGGTGMVVAGDAPGKRVNVRAKAFVADNGVGFSCFGGDDDYMRLFSKGFIWSWGAITQPSNPVFRMDADAFRMYKNLDMTGKQILNTSDRRMKRDITPTGIKGRETIRSYSFVDFYYTAENYPEEKQFGLIAQDTPVISLLGEDGYWAISSTKQTMLNSLAIKEIDSSLLIVENTVDDHAKRIEELEKENERMAQKIQLLEE